MNFVSLRLSALLSYHAQACQNLDNEDDSSSWFHNRSSLLDNDVLSTLSGIQGTGVERVVGTDVLFCPEEVPENARNYFLFQIGLVPLERYRVVSAFRDSLGETTLSMYVSRKSFCYDESLERFVSATVQSLVYASSRFFIPAPPSLR